jgi:Bacterial Ig domain
MKQLLIIFALLCGTALAQTTYYVDAGYTGGSDAGSQAHPWTSLSDTGAWSAVNAALASGAVTVFYSATTPGTSNPNVTTTQIDLSQRSNTSTNILTLDGASMKNTGSATVPVWSAGITLSPCIEPAPGDTNPPTYTCLQNTSPRFTIQASVPITGPTGASDYLNCVNYFTVQGFSFQGNGGQSADLTYIGNLTFQYNEVTRIALGSNGPGTYIGPGQHGPCHTGAARPSGTDSGPDNVVLNYNLIHDEWGECIYSGASTSDPFVNGAPGSSQQVEGGSASGTNLACGNGCSGNASCTAAVAANASTCSTGANYVVHGNTLFGCAAWGGQGDGTDIKDGHTNYQATNNQLYTTRYPACATGSPQCTNLICYNGTNAGTACTSNAQCTGGGRCGAGSDGRGMIIESCTLIDSNFIKAPGHDAIDLGDSWNTSTGRSACRISNNIAVDVNSGSGHNNGLELETLNVSGLAQWGNVTWFNNSVYNAGNNSVDTGACITTGSGSASGSVLMENNIFDDCTTQGSSFGIGTASFNNYFNTGTSCPGSETGTICTNPLFVSTATPYVDSNFKIQSGSGARAAGANLHSTFTNDYFSDVRPNSAFDIGADQFTSGGTYTITVTSPTNGVITSSDSVINCPVTCTDSTATGTVTLSATPSPGYTLSAWGGACSGLTCSVTTTATVSATFSATSNATSYVNASTGNDTYDCSSATFTSGLTGPCLTVARTESVTAASGTINIAAGTYRLSTGLTSTSGYLSAKNNQTLVGPSCTPTSAACAAIISGSIQLCSGSYTCSGPDGNGNWSVTGMTQQGTLGTTVSNCDPGWPGCIYPEDLFLNGAPLQHLSSAVTITAFSGTSGTLTFTANNNAVSGSTIALAGFTGGNTGLNGQTVTVSATGLTGAQFEAPVTGSGYASGTGTGTITNITSALSSSKWWFDYTNDIIYFHVNPSGQTIETSVLATMFNPSPSGGQANGITLNNLTIEEFAANIGSAGGIDPAFGGSPGYTNGINWTVENSYITLNHGIGVRMGAGMLVENSVSTANGNIGVGGGPATGAALTLSGDVVKGNTLSYNNYAHVNPGYQGGGFKTGNTNATQVRGNTVTNNIGECIHFDVNAINGLADGNTCQGNIDSVAGSSGSGITCEISQGCILRNNYINFTGFGGAVGLYSSSSTNVQAYCNVIEQSATGGSYIWAVSATGRGNYTVQPDIGNYIYSLGNYFHHNTIIWDLTTGLGDLGYTQNDATNQPNFFTNNTAPDYNMYHIFSSTASHFIYDDNTSGSNTRINFTTYQGNGAEPHGTIDTIYTSGHPTTTITSPADQSTFSGTLALNATASDSSGIASATSYVDWVQQTTISGAGPYSFSLSTIGNGAHTVAVMATANSGVKTCNAVTLTQTLAAPTGLTVTPGVLALPGVQFIP